MNSEPDLLREWQRRMAESLRREAASPPCRRDVTAVIHWFWDDERFDSEWFTASVAVGMTRRHCGAIPVVLVANRITPTVEASCAEQGVRLVVEPGLKPGLPGLNVEYIANLHRRFDTRFALVIQNDGFPLRPGLDEFVGPYDYIGAPWDLDGDDWIARLLFRRHGEVGNGGFSLRSRALCERAAWYYRRGYKRIPFCYLVVDDIFLCRVLPSFERRYRRDTVFAPVDVAARFSLERDARRYRASGAPPFGFHGRPAFAQLAADGHVG